MLVKAQGERERAIACIEAVLQKSAARDAAMRSAVPGCPPKPLTAEALLEVADAVKVPDTELVFFCACVHSLVAIACGVAKRHKIWQASDLKSSAKRIENAARRLEAAVNKASEGARERVRLCLPEPRATSLDQYAKQANELVTAAKVAGRIEHEEPWVLFRKILVAQLASDVEAAGGRLTVSGDDAGTFFQAFALLAPHLPEQFQISRGTLRRRWREWRRSKRARAEPK
jgi:hypothetical protein